MKYNDIPKRTRNGIESRLKQMIKKYGFDETKNVVNRHFNQAREKAVLEAEIKEAEDKLKELRKKK